MFTGLIEELGKIKSIRPSGKGRRISVEADLIFNDLKIDDSVAINGVCQTVVSINGNTFEVDAIEETMRKTTFASFKNGQSVNLERAMPLGGRMGGHLVQGHADCKGIVKSIEKQSLAVNVWVSFPQEFSKFVVPSGSICINGVSLTSARVEGNSCMVSIIPHTWKVTSLAQLSSGSEVNLEFDIIGKYVEKMLKIDDSKDTDLSKYIDQPEF